MKSLVDSNIFIGVWHSRDQYSEKSSAVLQKIACGEIKEVIITNYVLGEVVNFLLRKADYNSALLAYEYLTNAERIQVVYVDKIMEYEIKKMFRRYKTLSLTDCSLVALAKEMNINTIYSFDAGFDKVAELKRKE